MQSGMPEVKLGAVVVLRKKHPCGSDRWEITRLGVDIGMKCLGCGRRVMIPRVKFEKSLKQVLTSEHV